MIRTTAKPHFGWKNTDSNKFDAERFLWVFCLFTFLFFSAGHSSLPAYILPMIPAMALILGRRLSQSPVVRIESWGLLAVGVIFIIVAWKIDLASGDSLPVDLLHGYRAWWVAAALAMSVGFLLARSFKYHGPKAVTSVSVAALLSIQMLLWGYQSISAPRSSRQLASAIIPYLSKDTPVYSVAGYHQSLPFYIDRTVKLAIATGELEMGIKQDPDLWIADWESFKTKWMKENQAIAVFDIDDFKRLGTSNLPMKVIYKDPKKLAVIRR